MRQARTTTYLIALVGLLLAPAGCKQSDSILLIEVAGPKDLNPFQLDVTMTSGADPRNFSVPSPPGASSIILPASFTVALDRAHGAPIVVSINALDAVGSQLGFGTTMTQHIFIGSVTSISVMLMDSLPPDTVDGGSGASGADGGAGQGGQGGNAGQGGASGQAGATDGGDAMGLDGAAD